MINVLYLNAHACTLLVTRTWERRFTVFHLVLGVKRSIHVHHSRKLAWPKADRRSYGCERIVQGSRSLVQDSKLDDGQLGRTDERQQSKVKLNGIQHRADGGKTRLTVGPSEQSLIMIPDNASRSCSYNDSGPVSGVSPRPSFALRYSDACRKVMSVVGKPPKPENYRSSGIYLHPLP